MLRFFLDPDKLIQAVGYVLKQNNGKIDKYKLFKILYFADRKSLIETGEPITGDEPVAMRYGPLLSRLYDLTKGTEELRLQAIWNERFTLQGNNVALKTDPGTGKLSPYIEGILEEYRSVFAPMSFGETKQYSHENAPEYEDPGTSSKYITFEMILERAGFHPETVDEIARDQEAYREENQVLHEKTFSETYRSTATA